MGRGPDEYLDAALAILDEFGPADPRPGLSVAAMTAGAGVSRSSIYRHWASVDELNDDLTRYAVMVGEGWQRRVLDQPVDRPLGAVFAEVLDGSAPEVGIWARTGLPGWPAASAVRTEVAAWEAAWLDRFTAWLEAHLAAAGRELRSGGARQLAVAVTALVEGRLILERLWSQPDSTEWFTGRDGDAARSVERLFDNVTRPRTGSRPSHHGALDAEGWSPADLPAIDFGSAKRGILERATAAYLAAPFGSPAARAPGRLVDTGRLARRLQVTERRLYEIWPSTSDGNVAVFQALNERTLAFVDQNASDVLALGLVEIGYRAYVPLSVAGFQMDVETATTPGHAHLLFCTAALVDPALLAAFVETTGRAAPTIRTLFVALLGVGGVYLRPGVSLEEFLGEMRAVSTGMQRLAAVHPGLVGEQGELNGDGYPLCGLGCHQAFEAVTTDEPPPTSGRALAAPPINPRDW